MRAVELFAGAGGLALGISKAGFSHEAVIERDKFACMTIRHNKERGVDLVSHWPLHEGDVRQFDYTTLPEYVDLLAGGPPCQPFSLGGKHRGPQDERDLFPEAARAVSILKPRAFMFENVKGLLRPSFAKYFEYIYLRLTYPELKRRGNQNWAEHLARLERHHTRGRYKGLNYKVVFTKVNAADFGVPQKRERVIMVGFRSDLGLDWSFPAETHSKEALLVSQWVNKDYWERHEIPRGQRPPLPEKLKSQIERLASNPAQVNGRPWHTVRDAISDLPDPTLFPNEAEAVNHKLIPGARAYTGHTGSPLDEPAKALKAGDHGVPGGENMLAYPNGGVRYFTVRESARLQTFPDDFLFTGTWGETMRQLGNAVPVTLSKVIATSIRERLRRADEARVAND
jgi:DNA (cytosine-5)-methyltransferase 1